MANNLNTNPIVIDTAGATSAVSRQLLVRALKWDGPAAANDVCLVLDGAGGNEVWRHTANGANQGGQMEPGWPGLKLTGLYVQTLSSGKLYVYEG